MTTSTVPAASPTKSPAEAARERWSEAPADWRLKRTLRRGDTIAVSVRSARHVDPHRRYAAAPVRQVFDAPGKRWLYLEIPRSPRSTEVIWDPEESELSVGVWSAPLERVHRGGGRFPPELRWHASFWLPKHDGSRAQVRATRGALAVSVPVVTTRVG